MVEVVRRGRLRSRVLLGRILPDVRSCCVSRNASVSVGRRGLLIACQYLIITFFSSTLLRFSDTEEVKYENACPPHKIRYSHVYIYIVILKIEILGLLFDLASNTISPERYFLKYPTALSMNSW